MSDILPSNSKDYSQDRGTSRAYQILAGANASLWLEFKPLLLNVLMMQFHTTTNKHIQLLN